MSSRFFMLSCRLEQFSSHFNESQGLMQYHRNSRSSLKRIFANHKTDCQCCFCISTEQEIYTCPCFPAMFTCDLAAAAGFTEETAVLDMVVMAMAWLGWMEEER